MKRSDFDYFLPPERIAQYPLADRSASRLMVLDRSDGSVSHRHFGDLPGLLASDDLLVFNDTRVIPARLWGRKETGGKVEILIERMTGIDTALAHIRASKSPGMGARIHLCPDAEAPPGAEHLTVTGREGDLFLLTAPAGRDLSGILRALGHMPLPPYIRRADEAADIERYQTVYARREGAVAAPTAGLHFTEALLGEIEQRGIRRAMVTLHVGAGTFQPVRTDDIERHVMHSEYMHVDEAVCTAVRETRSRGGRVIAVGTTAVRCLESAATESGDLAPYAGDTDIFIHPGYRFRCVDAMVTNFHLPQSTLLMLVCAFAGRERILAAYAAAVDAGYRFFSYGDAMFLAGSGRRSAA